MSIRRAPWRALGLAAVVGAAAGCGPDAEGTPAPAPAPAPAAPRATKIARAIADAVASGEARDVLVRLDEPPVDADGDGTAGPARAAARARRRAPIAASVVAALAREGARARAYEHVPFVRAHVASASALAALERDPRVAAVQEDMKMTHMLAESLPLVRQPEALADGHDGAGTTVAVLDTGVDYTRAAFGACAAPGGDCKVAYAADVATDDGSLDDMGHGTNVSAIVLGVAPAAKVIGLDVFDGYYAYSSTLLTAVDWVIAHRDDYGIVAMNMSLGGGQYSAPCPSYPLSYAIAEARQAGILTAAAAGNDGASNALIYPACVPAAVSVGAVYDSDVGSTDFGRCSDARTAADQITCFSDSAPFLTLLAPGAFITAADMTFVGTSQASPHVAGAIAVVKSASPSLTPDETVTRLVASGKRITDPRNGVTTPRLDVAAAACTLSISPPSSSVPSGGGNITLTIDTAPSCAWAARARSGWLTVAANGVGKGTIIVHVPPNHAHARESIVGIGANAIVVHQASGS